MSNKAETIDFGAPAQFGVHVFRVEIPKSRSAPVVIIEDYGYKGAQSGIPQYEERVRLERRVWSKIAEKAKNEFNRRLKEKGLKTGNWHIGTNYVERLLGRELCVLAWASERATDDEVEVITSKWIALRPEERWWLFMVTVAEAGLPEDYDRGWRKALYYALSDGNVTLRTKRPRPVENDIPKLPLFER